MTKGAYGYCLFVVCLAGAFLTGLYTFRMFCIVFGGERSEFARGAPAPARERPRRAGLDALDGRRPRGALRDRRLPPVDAALAPAHRLARPGRAADRRPEQHAGVDRLGVRGRARPRRHLASPTWPTSARRSQVPKPVKLFEKKFYWDELYDAVFYKPADLIVARPRPLRRAAADRRLDREVPRRLPRRRRRARPRPERPRPRLRARARERRRRPRRRLHRHPMSRAG